PGDLMTSRVSAVSFLRNSLTLVVAFQDNRLIAYDVLSGKEVKTFDAKSKGAAAIKLSEDNKSLFVLNNDGIVQRFEYEAGQLLATYLPLKEGMFATIWRDNYYRMSPGAYRQVHFVKDLDVVGFENFDLVYNRPDIILSKSGGKNAAL